MAKDIALKNRHARIELPANLKGYLLRAQVDEALCGLTETTVEFMSPDLDLDLGKLVGGRVRLEIDAPKDKTRVFQGRCVSADYLGSHLGRGYFRAEIRPWLWFLTRASDCRVFQDMSALDVVKAVFDQHGFNDVAHDPRLTRPRRDYCVQYRETDFDFVRRLLEEEGIHWFFTHDAGKETLVLADDMGAHSPVPDHPRIDFHFREETYRRRDDHVFDWRRAERVRTGKVSLQSFDFDKPQSRLMATRALPRGRHGWTGAELYDYSGRHLDQDEGERQARIIAEAFAADHMRALGLCNVRQMAAGATFRLESHPRAAENGEYLVVSARHQIRVEMEQDREMAEAILGPLLAFDGDGVPDAYRCAFEAQPTREPFRAPRAAPRPAIPGLQTAMVVGKKDEEIWTDRHGRVKVRFHWDRKGPKDERASAWLRVASPWTGKGWGFVGIPRIGQEVVVQFEDGDPDRPLITGMVWNGESKPPYSLPGQQSLTGIRTNSTKGGAGFSELVFEDRKDAEFVRLRSERDFTQIVGNNAEITVGDGHKSPGTFRQTIHGDKTERIVEGDHAFIVAKGKESWTVARDRTASVGGDEALTVDGDRKATVKGASRTTVGKGCELDVGAALTLSARSKIVLRCGGSKVEITPAKVTISSPQVEVKATASAKVTAAGQLTLEGKGMASLKGSGLLKLEGGGMTQLKSSGLLMAKGALTLIN